MTEQQSTKNPAQPIGKKARKVQRRKLALIAANLKANRENAADE